MSTVYVRFDSGFDSRGGADRQRSAIVERLLARADGHAAVGDWRADAWQRLGGGAMPALAPAVYAAAFARTASEAGPLGTIFFATPVRYVAEMATVRMGEVLAALAPAEALAVAAEFNRVWRDGGVRLVAAPTGQLLCVFDHAIAAATRDPAEARGAPIDAYVAHGADAKQLRLLMSEIEMWLFDGPQNRARRARAAPEVSGFWLWGGGAPVQSAGGFPSWSSGGDVFFAALAATVAAAPDAALFQRSGVLVVGGAPGSAAWDDFEARWLPAALAGLQAGPDRCIDLSAGARRYRISARWRRRFWRRPRPWWDYFA